mmetsp:Transcript_4471/g.10303  ORF Transcript_4471/g.10303 Transcript_4471/m.10303 type:complete len:106 (-) Transcript_4471:101-418(-)
MGQQMSYLAASSGCTGNAASPRRKGSGSPSRRSPCRSPHRGSCRRGSSPTPVCGDPFSLNRAASVGSEASENITLLPSRGRVHATKGSSHQLDAWTQLGGGFSSM